MPQDRRRHLVGGSVVAALVVAGVVLTRTAPRHTWVGFAGRVLLIAGFLRLAMPFARRWRRRMIGPAFDCGVRVVQGTLAGEERRWRHRPTTVTDGCLVRGRVVVPFEPVERVRNTSSGFGLSRQAHVWRARVPGRAATIEIAVMPYDEPRLFPGGPTPTR